MDSSSLENLSENNSESRSGTITQRMYGPEDVLQVQKFFLETLEELTVKELQKQETLLRLGDDMLDVYGDQRGRFAEEYCNFKIRHEHWLKRKAEAVRDVVSEFGDGLREMVDLYVEVNDEMKEQQKNAAKQDAFVVQVDKNINQYMLVKKNLEQLKQELAPVVPPIRSTTALTSSSNSSEDFVQANTISKPFKPIETEIATHTTRIIDEISTLRRHFEAFPDVVKHTEPIVAQSKLVVEKVLKEFPARPLKSFIDTLPPEQRD